MSFKCFLQTVPAWLCERQLFRPHGLWRHSSMEFSSPVHFTSSSQNFPVIPRPKAWRLVKNKYIHFNTRFLSPLYWVKRCVYKRILYPSKLPLVAITLNKTRWGKSDNTDPMTCPLADSIKRLWSKSYWAQGGGGGDGIRGTFSPSQLSPALLWQKRVSGKYIVGRGNPTSLNYSSRAVDVVSFQQSLKHGVFGVSPNRAVRDCSRSGLQRIVKKLPPTVFHLSISI